MIDNVARDLTSTNYGNTITHDVARTVSLDISLARAILTLEDRSSVLILTGKLLYPGAFSLNLEFRL